MEVRAPAYRSSPPSVREGVVVLPGRLLLDVSRQLPAGECRSAAPGRTGRRDRQRAREVTCARCVRRTSRAARSRWRPGHRHARAGVRRDDRDGRASASRDETRPILTGILVSAEGGELKMVATDSYRLSVKETALDRRSSGFEPTCPPARFQELERIVAAAATSRYRIGVRATRWSSRSAASSSRRASSRPVPQLSPAAARELRAQATAVR